MTQHSDNIVKSKEIVGVDVKNRANEDLGRIEEIVLDKHTGQTLYLVLESGGVLGMGSKLFALPWNSVHYEPEEECFLLNIEKEKLKTSSGFNKEYWPEKADITFTEFPETTY